MWGGAAVVLMVVLVGVRMRGVVSMRFDLQSGTSKCVSEDIKANAMSLGRYVVVNPYDESPLSDIHKVNVRFWHLKTYFEKRKLV
uniref:Uncharacterized protein n=1 Tax=Cannabis sativa TaxID=3483 RepID=A0A803QMI8_CANSA